MPLSLVDIWHCLEDDATGWADFVPVIPASKRLSLLFLLQSAGMQTCHLSATKKVSESSVIRVEPMSF